MHSTTSTALVACAGVVGLTVAACTSEPQYLGASSGVEYEPELQMGDPPPPPPSVSLTLPLELETPEDAMARFALAGQLGIEVPYVVVGDLDVSVEWTARNLDNEPGQLRVLVNGASPFFAYEPSLLVVDPEEDPTPPPLMGDIPVDIGPLGEVSGVFREDEVREASIDLELITRGNLNPFAAMLTINEDLTSYQPMTPLDPDNLDVLPTPVGPPIPIEAFAQMIRFDVGVTADRHLVLEFVVRVRDRRGVLHDEGMAAPPGEITFYQPAVYNPLGTGT